MTIHFLASAARWMNQVILPKLISLGFMVEPNIILQADIALFLEGSILLPSLLAFWIPNLKYLIFKCTETMGTDRRP